jgi:hypothetical protein
MLKMTGKIAIVINSGLDQRLKVLSGLHVAKRIFDAREENGIEKVEVFLFAGGVKALEPGQDNKDVEEAIQVLRNEGITLEACLNQVRSLNIEETFSRYGIDLEFSRDAFSRYAVEGYTVISF